MLSEINRIEIGKALKWQLSESVEDKRESPGETPGALIKLGVLLSRQIRPEATVAFREKATHRLFFVILLYVLHCAAHVIAQARPTMYTFASSTEAFRAAQGEFFFWTWF